MTKFGIAAFAAATALGVAGVAQAGPAINLANGEKAAPQTDASVTPVYHYRYGYYHGYYPRYHYRPYYYRPYGYYGYPGYYDYGPSFRFGIDIR
jgi:hypothetical protein